jgi:quercetin dioxygenase-like cupin family protein
MINVIEDYATQDRWPLTITHLKANTSAEFKETCGTYYVLMRSANFSSEQATFKNTTGAFAVNHGFSLSCDDNSSATIISYHGLHLYEQRYYVQNELEIGNLSYMDGGTNTTAVNPGRLGDPVVNYVHFPAHMYQTLHTHPSHRIGHILKGNGRIELDNNEMFVIKEGSTFFMRRNELHNFITDDEDVVLFVFAPDSGTGPTDEVNPLKIRTYVGQQRSIR